MIEGQEFEPDQETLTIELTQAGFEDGEINKAFDWLEDLSELCDAPVKPIEGAGCHLYVISLRMNSVDSILRRRIYCCLCKELEF